MFGEEGGAFAQPDGALDLDRVLGDPEARGRLLLGQPVHLSQGYHLAAPLRQGLDGLFQKFKFLGVGNDLRCAGSFIHDGQGIRIR